MIIFSESFSSPTSLYRISAKCLTSISPLYSRPTSAKTLLIFSFISGSSCSMWLVSNSDPKHPLHSVIMSFPCSSAMVRFRAAMEAHVVLSNEPNTPGAGQHDAPSMSLRPTSNASKSIRVAFSIPGYRLFMMHPKKYANSCSAIIITLIYCFCIPVVSD
ncbi:MAG: hypothetical protein BWY74_01291 [Firmicutes bacterium ADurb.Bin419]|nr:MAG: hypothetical protein BWY74_01291 [Firmicutes bacterium ADurb.Bin419]